ncbi:MAG: ankyrin repeat domain-containing protein [Gemmatimonadetes bacterium]|nr:ankyrin repeat domain-containing protein [Gemmatimonadota bacterium]
MPDRQLPVHPDLDQFKVQAKELLRAIRAREPDAIAELAARHPKNLEPALAMLADAQLVLARQYGASSWPRLVHACQMADALWAGDAATVRRLIRQNPALLVEHVLLGRSNWGAPMSYAATVGQFDLVRLLHDLGATDHGYAMGRAMLKGFTEIATFLHARLGRPRLAASELGGPAYTLNIEGTRLALALGAPVVDDEGGCLAPVDVVLETDSRNPAAKHEILELYVRHGVRLPDTAPMAIHRGRVDLLDALLARDPSLLTRQYPWEEIYPPVFRCGDEVQATHGTPLRGATLLHLCVDYDEYEIAEWLLARGFPVDAPAAVDAEGFGGHTALFATVVSQPAFWMNHQHRPPEARVAELLLAHGANPNARASLRKQLHPGYGPDVLHEYRDVTPISWGRRFHRQVFVSEPAIAAIAAAGGRE